MTCPFKSNKNAAGDGLARLSGINTPSHLKAIGKPHLIGSSSWKPGLRVLLQMHPVPTDTRAIRTALWMPPETPTAQIPEHSGTYRPKEKVRTELVCFHCAFPPSLTMEIYHTIGSFIFALCLFFPDSCLPCFLFLFPLFSRMFISRTASVLSSPGTSLPEYLLSPLLPSLSLFLRVSPETGLVAWLPSAAFFFFFLWGWDQMASNRSSWSPWLPGWQSIWERHILQPGAARPFLRGRKKIKPLPSYLHIYIFLKCSRTQTLFMFYIATLWLEARECRVTFFYPKKKTAQGQK